MGFLPTITFGARRDLHPGKRKTALVCAGGGITGAVYEVGVLQALSVGLPNFSLNAFDIYVGVSSGAFVASFLANGVPSEELFRSMAGCARSIENLRRSELLKVNWGEFAVRAARAPGVAGRVMWNYLAHSEDMTLTDAMMMFGDNIPTALLTNTGLESYIRRNLSHLGRTDDFRHLNHELYIPAINLDTGERVVFGESGREHVPISRAVRASASLPIAFRPTRIEGCDYIDGAVEKNFHLDIAIAHGAELIVCINPLVPLMNDPNQVAVPLFANHPTRYLSEKGLPTVLDQAFRLILQSRMQAGFEVAVQKAPHVDVVMFEPEANDYKMFFYNILRYSARIILAKHGFMAARQIIERNFDDLERLFAKHDIELSRAVLEETYEEMKNQGSSLTAAVTALSGRLRGERRRKSAVSSPVEDLTSSRSSANIRATAS